MPDHGQETEIGEFCIGHISKSSGLAKMILRGTPRRDKTDEEVGRLKTGHAWSLSVQLPQLKVGLVRKRLL